MAAVFDENEVDELVVVGFKTCPFYQEALGVAQEAQKLAKTKRFTNTEFPARPGFKQWLTTVKDIGITGDKHLSHTSSPFVYVVTEDGTKIFVGGCDSLKEAIMPDLDASEEVKQQMGSIGEMTDEALMNMAPMVDNLINTYGEDEARLLMPVLYKRLKQLPLNMKAGVDVPDAKAYFMDKSPTSIHELTTGNIPTLLNFGSFT